MPNLPTLAVPDGPNWDRLIAAFHGDPAEYKTWLRAALRAEVVNREAGSLRSTLDEQIAANVAEVDAIIEAAS